MKENSGDKYSYTDFQSHPLYSVANQFEHNKNTVKAEEHVDFLNLDPFLLSFIWPFLIPALLALGGFIVRVIVTKKKTTLIEFSLDSLAAMIIGAVISVLITDMTISDNFKIGVIAIAGMVGPDMAGGVIILGQAFRESPTDFITKHIKIFRGVQQNDEKKDSKQMTYEEWDKANKEFIDKTFG
jgi:hypothetical protein